MKEIKGFAGYYIDDEGRVFSRHKTGQHGKQGIMHETCKKLSTLIVNGAVTVQMKDETGTMRRLVVGRLMLDNFGDGIDDRQIVKYRDGDIHNLTVGNLEAGNRSVPSTRPRITEDEQISMRQSWQTGMSVNAIAKTSGRSYLAVKKVLESA